MPILDFDITLVDVNSIPAPRTSQPMSCRDWLNLGVLCVAEAETAGMARNHNAARYYAELAKKCDRMAAEVPPRAARGTVSMNDNRKNDDDGEGRDS